MKSIYKILIGLFLVSAVAYAVNYSRFDAVIVKRTMSIGSDAIADAKAVLDVSSTTLAFLPPRMTATQRDNISGPTAGSIVYNSTSSNLNLYDGTAWRPLAISTGTATRVEAARLNCDAGSAITSQNGTWISSIGNISAGACAVTLTTGVFSATPWCTAIPSLSGGISLGQELNTDATSATAVSVDCEDDASTACTVADFTLICVGPK